MNLLHQLTQPFVFLGLTLGALAGDSGKITQVVVQSAHPLPAAAQWEQRWREHAATSASAQGDAAAPIADLLLQHLAEHGWPVMAVASEPVRGGVLPLTLTEGAFAHISLKGGTPGQQAAAESLWQREAARGMVRTANLTALLDFYHRNPHHAMLANFTPGTAAHEADVLVDLSQSPRPYAVSAGWGNDGIKPLSSQKYWMEVEESDAFGLPHLLSIRAQVGEDFASHYGVRGLLRCFLPWQHELTIHGIVNRGQLFEEGSDITADTRLAGLRYLMPTAWGNHWKVEPGLGFDFRTTDNTQSFAGESLGRAADSFHLLGELSFLRETPGTQDSTGLRLEAGYSPGGVTSDNSDEAFHALREGTSSEFWFARLSAWHRQSWGDWTLLAKAQAQYASEPLLPHDQLAVGGTAGVRGYEELSGLADQGAWGSLELGGPVLRMGQGKTRMGVQPVAFVDAGWAKNMVQGEDETLASGGLGLRWQISRTFGFSADHAWQLEDSGSRFHLAATLRF